MESVDELERLCRQILGVDPMLRSARLINSRGHLLAGGMRDGLRQLEAQRHDEMLFVELALRVRMRQEFDAELGKVNFSLSYRDKVVVMSFPLAGGNVLLASGEKDIDFGSVPFRILDLLSPLRDG